VMFFSGGTQDFPKLDKKSFVWQIRSAYIEWSLSPVCFKKVLHISYWKSNDEDFLFSEGVI
jgi:hypothetical protein